MSFYAGLSERQKVERKYFNSYASKVLNGEFYNSIDIETAFSKAAFDNRFVINLLGDIYGKKILDLGCGVGEQAVYFGKKGGKVSAIDISEGLLEVARLLMAKQNLIDQVSIENMTAEDLKFEDDYFDIVYGREILHHVDIQKAVKEIKRVLKPGGLALFIEPLGMNPLISLYRKIAGKFRTPTEMPLTKNDFKTISCEFPGLKYDNFYLFSLVIFAFYYIYKRLKDNRGDMYYWMKDIEKGKALRRGFVFLQRLDRAVLRLMPCLKQYCWITVMWAKIEKG